MNQAHRQRYYAYFDHSDIGCIADGSLGHSHVRAQLAEIYIHLFGDIDVSRSLLGPMPDDAWDENEALDTINSRACGGVAFELYDGDLCCVALEDAS